MREVITANFLLHLFSRTDSCHNKDNYDDQKAIAKALPQKAFTK